MVATMSGPRISVCIVTSRRPELLADCLASLATQVKAPEFEVLVCANDDPATESVVRHWFPRAVVAHLPATRLGMARNALIRAARGELLLFLDDDVTAHPRLLQRLDELATDHPEAAVFGGPNLNPPHSPWLEVVQGGVLASLVAAGPVRRRYGTHPAGPADERFFTLCNLAVRRDVMVEFPADVTGGEENAVLLSLAQQHVPMHYDPALQVFHRRRPTIGSFATQVRKYGYGRGEVIARTPGTGRLAHFAPTAWLAYLIVAPLLSAALSPLALLPIAVYLAAVVATGVKVAAPLRSTKAALVAMALVVVVHASYGTGLVAGLLARPVEEEEPVPVWSDARAA
jgi:glycosyltransferase involved in cell wall biosynthesis